jgi:hypothetical protein
MDMRALAATIKARWVCEQAHQQLKKELGLDHTSPRANISDTNVWQLAFFPAPRHIAGRPRPNASPSSATRCRRSPAPHRRPDKPIHLDQEFLL